MKTAIPLVDLEALAQACEAGDLAAFEATPQLGWALTEPAREALLHALANTNHHGWYSYGTSAFTLAQALALLAEAATNESGIAITEQVRSLRLGKEIAIAFRDDHEVHFGVRYAQNLPMTPGHLWPELKPWYKVLGRNREQLGRWAKSAEGIVSVPLRARVAGAEASVERSGDELLAAIIANPDDIAARLVYADWLVSQGDARGELIQLCELRRTSSDPALQARIEELERAYRERIAGEVAQLASSYRLERGFVTQIEMPAPTFAKHGKRLLAMHPIALLRLKPVNPQALARLARADALRGLRGLYVSQIIGKTRPMPFDELCGSDHFDSLENLEVWTWVSDGDPEAAFVGLRAPRLASMHLYEVDGAPQILAGLARNESVRLRRLEVNLRGRTAWPALDTPAFARLEQLRLDSSDPGGLLEGAELPALVSLQLTGDAPLELVEFPTLERLSLDGGPITRAGLQRLLARLPRLQALQVWELDGPLDVDAALELLLALPDDHPLTAIRLPTHGANPELVARAAQRFPRDFYDR